MASIKKGDFIEVEYTGRTKEGDFVFDTTDEKIAKEADMYSKEMAYGPVVVCLGQEQLIPGLEKELEEKEIGKEYKVELDAENGFGKKDAKLIRMIPASAFKKQNIMPEPGMQINIDGMMGIIKTAAGGRCLVDFNHPLSGKEVVYTIKVNKIVEDDKEKVKSFVSLALNAQDAPVEVADGKAVVTVKNELPKEISEALEKKLKELVPTVKELSFKTEKKS